MLDNSAELDVPRQRGILRVFLQIQLATIAACVMVLGVALPSQAATTTYWNGSTIVNAIKSSSTHSMKGGTVGVDISTSFILVRATVSSVGSFQSTSPLLSYSHASLSTHVYCQWRVEYPNASPPGATHKLTCKYTY